MAAETLNVTAAALTSRIKHLEEDARTLLFDRVGGRLRLTDAGQEVVNAATRINLVLNDLDNTLTAIRDKKAGRVTVGVVSTAKYFAPRLIAAFSRQNPRIEVSISVGNRAEIIESLRDYSIDLAMMGRPLLDFEVSSEYFGEHPQVVIAAPDHPLASRKTIDKAELSSEELHRSRARLRHARRFRLFFQAASSCASRASASRSARTRRSNRRSWRASGLALISAHTIEAEVAAGRLVVLDVVGLPIMREWFVVHRADHVLSPIGQAMWDFTVQEGKDFLPKVV